MNESDKCISRLLLSIVLNRMNAKEFNGGSRRVQISRSRVTSFTQLTRCAQTNINYEKYFSIFFLFILLLKHSSINRMPITISYSQFIYLYYFIVVVVGCDRVRQTVTVNMFHTCDRRTPVCACVWVCGCGWCLHRVCAESAHPLRCYFWKNCLTHTIQSTGWGTIATIA